MAFIPRSDNTVRTGLYNSVRGCFLQQLRLDTVANNIANINSPGFRHDRIIFSDLLARQTQTDFRQGQIRPTDNRLDLAIAGKGFFKIKTPQGIRYTRNGNFTLTKDGGLTTSQGFPVLGRRGPITVTGSARDIHIDRAGNVYDRGENVDRLALVAFTDNRRLEKTGHTMFKAPPGVEKPAAPGKTEIMQGALEMTNTNPVTEMVKMIEVHRSYESHIKVIQALSAIDEKSANQVGRLQ